MTSATASVTMLQGLLLSLLAVVAGCTPSREGTGSESAAAKAGLPLPHAQDSASAQPAAQNAGPGAGLPDHFHAYSTTPVGNGRACIAGAVDDGEGGAQRPLVIMRKGERGPALWTREIRGLDGMYQTRATHCADSGTHLYVLLQSDTDSVKAQSQTQLSVARLDESGAAAPAQYVDVPGTRDKAYSAWVSPGSDHFRLTDGKLKLQVRYFLMDNRDAEKDVALELSVDPTPL